ncbi:MAG TPA: NUDIX hydrolase, partial [Euzebyales bacterium]
MAGGGRQPTALAPKEKHDDPYCHSVSVAAVIVRKEDDRVLAIRRRDNGAWQPPGGVLEPAEDIIEGLIREAAEEAGVIVRSPQLTGAYKHVGGPIVSLVFRCTIRRRVWDATRKTGGETVDVRWMTRAEIVEQMDRVFAPRVLDALDYVDRP